MEFEDAKTALSDSYISTERIREQVRADIAYSDLSDAGIVAATRLFDKAQHMAKVLNRVWTDLSDKLVDTLNENDFEILHIQEGRNLAEYKNEDPICIRIICRRRWIHSSVQP